MDTVGSNLKALRKSKGLTQLELSQESFVSKSYISEIENEIHVNITVSVICALCRVLRVTPNDLIPEEFYK